MFADGKKIYRLHWLTFEPLTPSVSVSKTFKVCPKQIGHSGMHFVTLGVHCVMLSLTDQRMSLILIMLAFKSVFQHCVANLLKLGGVF
jgi:hypothetical protein